MESPVSEFVLVIPRAEFDQLGGHSGFTPFEAATPLLDALLGGPAMFRSRAKVETDETWLQVIPYVSLRWNGKIFSYDRGQSGGEGQLYNYRSVGIGGHVNDQDVNPHFGFSASAWRFVEAGLRREVHEEMGYTPDGDLYPLGMIFDPSDAVGRVHLGICYMLDLNGPPLVPIDSTGYAMVDLTNPEWGTLYESWSRIVLYYLRSQHHVKEIDPGIHVC